MEDSVQVGGEVGKTAIDEIDAVRTVARWRKLLEAVKIPEDRHVYVADIFEEIQNYLEDNHNTKTIKEGFTDHSIPVVARILSGGCEMEFDPEWKCECPAIWDVPVSEEDYDVEYEMIDRIVDEMTPCSSVMVGMVDHEDGVFSFHIGENCDG